MDNFISNAESLSYIHQHRVKSQQQQYKSTKTHTMATTNIQPVKALQAATDIKQVNLKCIFCNSTRHNSKRCDANKTYREKTAILKTKRGCWSCLSVGHSQRECSTQYTCYQCERKGLIARHHWSLHSFDAENPRNNPKTTSKRTEEGYSKSNNKQPSSKGKQDLTPREKQDF